VRSPGEGLFDHPHSLRIDADDNIWTTDDTNNMVLKLSPAGKVLMVLGRRNSGGEAKGNGEATAPSQASSSCRTPW
jgi:streptogramin lyase